MLKHDIIFACDCGIPIAVDRDENFFIISTLILPRLSLWSGVQCIYDAARTNKSTLIIFDIHVSALILVIDRVLIGIQFTIHPNH